MDEELKPKRPVTAFRGAFLTVGMRWADRLLGLVSTVILARLLVPDDFGLVAMAMVVVGLFDVLLNLGVSAALVQHSRAGPEEFNTAWTLRLAQCAATALLLAVLAPFAADYYGDPRVTAVLWVSAITVVVGGLENIGTVSFQRNLEFGRDFQFTLFKRVVGFVFTLTAAVMLRSYWALVLGSLVSRLSGVAASYWMSGFRPRFTLSRISDIWSFSQWSLFTNIAQYLNGAIPRFVLGGRANAAALGAYTMGEEIATLPTSELLAPLGRVMFPSFAAVRDSPAELLRLVSLAQAVQTLFAIPLSIGVVLVADDAVPLLLGDQWIAAVPIAQILALTGVASALGHSPTYMMIATGRMRVIGWYTWAKLVLLVLLLLLVFRDASPEKIAIAGLCTAAAGLVVVQAIAWRLLPGLGGRRFWSQTWRPVVSAALMAVAVVAVSTVLEDAGRTPRLVAGIASGAVAYVLAVLAFWTMSGRPPGAESYLLERVVTRRVRRS
jgi:O-antigen/teichoic acid export membrane protein